MYEDDEELEPCDKFDECGDCKHRFDPRICAGCGMGEEFEPDDMEEVDAHFNGRV